MKISLNDNLPFVKLKLKHDNNTKILSNVLIDTGSASTLISADIALELGLKPGRDDKIYTIKGVGGVEFVYEKSVQEINLDCMTINDFVIQIGAMEYGFDIEGILGMDFLIHTNAIIDIGELNLYLNKRNL